MKPLTLTARESREQAPLVLNRGEKCKGKRQESGPNWSAVWPRLPSYPEEASRRASGQDERLRRLSLQKEGRGGERDKELL